MDDYSSAHVYLRLPEDGDETIDTIPAAVLEECCQLVKANSIQGNKLSNIFVVYTPWANLKKKPSMEVGQVGFHDKKAVKRVKVEHRINAVVNALNKTKDERNTNLQGSALLLPLSRSRFAVASSVTHLTKHTKHTKHETRSACNVLSTPLCNPLLLPCLGVFHRSLSLSLPL